MALKFTDVRANPYTRAKISAMGNKLFSEDDWRTSFENGTIDVYISAMNRSKNIDPDEFYKKYDLYFGDPTNKLQALYTEVGADRTKKQIFDVPLYDENGYFVYDENGNQMFEQTETTEYDYLRNRISAANKMYALKELESRRIEERENRNQLLVTLGDIGIVGLQALQSVGRSAEVLGGLIGATVSEIGETGYQSLKLTLEGLVGSDSPNAQDVINVVSGIATDEERHALSEYLKGDMSYAERVNHWLTEESILDDTQNQLDQLAYNATHFYNHEGEQTTVGKYVLGVTDTLAAMVPSLLIGYATSGLGTALLTKPLLAGSKVGSYFAVSGTGAGLAGSKVGSFLTTQAGAISQLSYYAGNVFAKSVSEQYQYYSSQGMSVTSSEIVGNALVKSMLQLGVEKGLGLILGGTGIDDMFWGTSTKNNLFRFSSKNLTSKYFGRLGKDMLQEGLEEALQETSDWFVDAGHYFINHDFQATKWNWQNIWDAFAIACVTSIVGSSSRLLGQTVTRKVKTGKFGLETDIIKVDEDFQLVKDENGDYDYVTLNPFAAYEYGVDFQSYVENIDKLKKANSALIQAQRDNIDSKKLAKAESRYLAAYYQAVGSMKIMTDLYGEMGEFRFKKANEILTSMQKSYNQGRLDKTLRTQAQREIINAIPELKNFQNLKSFVDKMEESEISTIEKTIKKNEAIEVDEKTAKEVKEFFKSLEGVDTVNISSDGKMPVKIANTLIIPKNLLENGGSKVVMASLAEQQLADELAEGVLTKAKYLGKELSIVTDLYRQWVGNKDATAKESIYGLIFDTDFYRVILATNEKITSSFVLRLNQLVKLVGKKQNLENSLLNKRMTECRARWIEVAYQFYSNNLNRDTSLFTAGLTQEEKKSFDERLSKQLTLYNVGADIVRNKELVSDDVWNFIDRRIAGMNVDDTIKASIKVDIRSDDSVKRQKALNKINDFYEGAFETLYDGKTYMPENSVGNCALNSWLESRGHTLKTLFNSDYFTNEDLKELGPNYTLNDIFALRSLQFETAYPNMKLVINSTENVSVEVEGGDSGFMAYVKVYNKEQENIVSGKEFTLNNKSVERRSITSLSETAKWLKDYLQTELVKDGAHEFLTVNEIVNHPEYLSPAVKEDILNEYNVIDKISTYRYLQKELCNDTDGKKSLVLRQDGTVTIGNMSAMQKIMKKNAKYPTKNGTYKITDFVNSSFLSGSLANIKVVFSDNEDNRYVDYRLDGDLNVFVNTIYIDTKKYKTSAEISFALCHEFQHAIQTENKLVLGTSHKLLDHMTKDDKKAIIETVKELEPELFVNVKNAKDTEKIVRAYIYHASGEFQAWGLGAYGEIGFYPVIVSHKRGRTAITFRNGKSFTTAMKTNPIVASRNVFDQTRTIIENRYARYDIKQATPTVGMNRYARLKELNRKHVLDRTKDEHIETMYCRLNVASTLDEFRESDVFGIELDGVKYALANAKELSLLLNEITRDKDYKEDTVDIKLFTFKPKDINIFKPRQSSAFTGEIVINDSKLSNRDNVSVKLDKKAETASTQNLKDTAISVFTGEVLSELENLSDLSPKLYEAYEKFSKRSDGEFGNFVKLNFDLLDLIAGTEIGEGFDEYMSVSNTILHDDNGDEVGANFPDYAAFDTNARKKFVRDIMSDPTFRNEMFEIWLNNWGWANDKKPTMDEFLNMDLPIIRIHNEYSDYLDQTYPFVSVAIADNDEKSIYALSDFLKRQMPSGLEFSAERMEAGEVFNEKDLALIDAKGGVKGHLFFGTVKVKDVITFAPSGLLELLVDPNHLTEVGIPFETAEVSSLKDIHGLGFRFDEQLDYTNNDYESDLDEYEAYQSKEDVKDKFDVSDKKEKASVGNAKKTKPTKADNKIVDRRPKSERDKEFDYDSKKYDRHRSPLGESKRATRIVSAKDIVKDLDGKPIRAPRGGDYVYREFVERRYYIKSDRSEGYKDIFDYYTNKGPRRHSLKSETTDTNLKYFTTEKGKAQISTSEGFRDFVIESTYVDIDPFIMSKIKNGTLTSDDLLHYVMDRPLEEVDNHTFSLILDKVYHNENIKTREELEKLVFDYGPKMTALYLTLKGTDFEDFMYDRFDSEKFDAIWNFFRNQSQFSKSIDRIYAGVISGKSLSLRTFNKERLEDYQPLDADVLTKESLYKMIRFYKGDVASGSQAILRARKSAFKDGLTVGQGYQQSRFGQKGKYSLDAKIKAGAKTSFLDNVKALEDTPDSDASFYAEADDLAWELTDITQGIGRRVYDALAQKAFSLSNEPDVKKRLTFAQESIDTYFSNLQNLSEGQIVGLYREMINSLSEESLNKLYFLAEFPGFENVIIEDAYTKQQDVKRVLNKIFNYGSKVQGIQRRLGTIRKYVKTTVERNLVLKDFSDILDDNLRLKKDAYYEKNGYKSMEELEEIHDRIRALKEAVVAGVYSNRESYNRYIKKLDKKTGEIDKLMSKITTSKSTRVKFINMSSDGSKSNSSNNNGSAREIPNSIRRILATGLTHTGRAKIQELSNYHEEYNEDGSTDKVYDDKYVKLTMTHLLRENADTLNGMSEDEAIEILELYAADNVLIADIDSQIVSETLRLTCAYLLGESRNYEEGFQRFNFPDALVKKVEAKMMEQAHMSAVILSNERTVIRLLQPAKVIAEQLAKNLGFELDEVDKKNLDDMLSFMRVPGKNGREGYDQAKKRFEEKLIKDWDEKSKRSKLDKLLAWERAMMLSNPGTWVRNVASNYIVEGGNKLSFKTGKYVTDLFMKVFPKTKDKFDILEGYQFDKKASKATIKFIDEKFEKSGLFKEIIAGVSKYDDITKDAPPSDDIVDMTARAIHANIRKKQVFKNKGWGKFCNNVLGLIYKGLNDDPWIKRTTKRYLGQIIEEDYEKAKRKAAEKGKTLTYEEFLKSDKSNMYGITKHIASAFVKAVNLASYDYMKSPNFITQMEKTLRMNVPKGAWFMYKQVFPFLASSWNWCVEGMRYTPAGLLNAVIKLARLEHTVTQMDKAHLMGKSVVSGEFAKYLQLRNVGKGAIGTLGFAIGSLLFALGWAGIDEDDDEYKLLIGDLKVNINDVLGSQGVMLGIAISQNRADEGKDGIDVLAESFNQLFRDSIFQDFIDTFRYEQGFGDFMLSSTGDILTQFWPNILKTASNIVNYRGVQYSDDKLTKMLQRLLVKNIPLPANWLSANIKINPYTGTPESFYSGELFADIFSKLSPVDVSYPSVSREEAIAIGLGISKGTLSGKYVVDETSVELSSKELTKLNMLYGKLNKSKLSKFYGNTVKVKVKNAKGQYEELTYSKMTDEQRRAATNTIMSNNSSIAKIYILTSTGKYKYYADKSQYEELRKLGVIKNVYQKNDKRSGFVRFN